MKECILCKKDYEGHGHNADPISKGECCDDCEIKVIVKRIEKATGGRVLEAGVIKFEGSSDPTREMKYKVAKQMATDMFEKAYGKNKLYKANMLICTRIGPNFELHNNARRSRCDHCGESIIYDPENVSKVKKNAEKICTICVLKVKKYSKNLNKEQKEVLEMSQ